MVKGGIKMYEPGRVCMKIAGRDSNKLCVIVDVIDANFVLIDGETRRKKVNIKHIEPLKKTLDIKKGASRADVIKAFKALGKELKDTKPKKSTERPKKKKVKKIVEKAPKKAVKKEIKKETAKTDDSPKKEASSVENPKTETPKIEVKEAPKKE